jgi:hypothetical protein
MKPKALFLHKIPGLEYIEDEDNPRVRYNRDFKYKWRDKWEDMEVTKAFYDQYPPQEGDLVVVLHTASGYEMLRPDVKPIIAITKQKRIVVDHIHECWAGKSFWRTGQNCKAPRGQCWLVPAELYRDIPKYPERIIRADKTLMELELENEDRMIQKGYKRGLSRWKNMVGGS